MNLTYKQKRRIHSVVRRAGTRIRITDQNRKDIYTSVIIITFRIEKTAHLIRTITDSVLNFVRTISFVLDNIRNVANVFAECLTISSTCSDPDFSCMEIPFDTVRKINKQHSYNRRHGKEIKNNNRIKSKNFNYKTFQYHRRYK